MNLEVLMSCMHQSDEHLISDSRISGDVLMINQCSREEETSFSTARGTARIFSTLERGLTKSRNMAIENACGDICLICDDDETLEPAYEDMILGAYQALPDADIIIFNMVNMPARLGETRKQIRFPATLHVSSCQITFRRVALLRSGVRFDPLLGAGSGNGAEEELKFMLDCQRAGLKICYSPEKIASVAQSKSTWFSGFHEEFFESRGATTRYILGAPLASLYAVYYVLKKRPMYQGQITGTRAMKAIFRGIHRNKIGKQARERSTDRV